MALRNLLRNRDDDTPQGNPYDSRSEDPDERSLARKWEQQQINPLPIWDRNNVTFERQGDSRSEDPTERRLARDSSREMASAFAQNYGLEGYTPGATGLLPADRGMSQAMGWEDLLNRWTGNKDPTLPTMNMTPEQKQQFLQQVYANPGVDPMQFLTPEQRQVAQTMFTFYDQSSGFDGFQKALMAGAIGGFGALAGPSMFGGAATAPANGPAAGIGELGSGTFGLGSTPIGLAEGGAALGTGAAGVPGAGAMLGEGALGAGTAGGFNIANYVNTGILPGMTPPPIPPIPGGGGFGLTSLLGPLSNLLPSGENDLTKTLGTLGQTLLGGYAANQQSGAYSDLANQFLGMGQPYRDRLNATYDPNWSFANTPDMQRSSQAAMDQAARALSTKFGNPAESPSAIGELLKYGIDNNLNKSFDYRNQLGQFGGLGSTPVAAGANSGLLGVKAQGGLYESLGSGFENLMNPYKLNTGNYL